MKMNSQTPFWTALLLTLFPLFSLGQGEWVPSGADFSHPRTLLQAPEIPAVQNYLSHPEIWPLYQSIYNQAKNYVPSDMTVNGHRRTAAHVAKNSAFILLLDRKPVGNLSLDTLSDAETDLFRARAVSLLNIINTSVEAYPDIVNYLWRSNEIIDNAIAYDLLKGAGVPQDSLNVGRDLIQEMAGNLYEEIEFNLFGLGFFGFHVDNHALRSAGALGVAAIALNDVGSADPTERPINWINLAMYNIDNVLFTDNDRQSERGVLGGYSEGTHYLRFGMKHVLPFVHALGNFLPDGTANYTFDGTTRAIRNPWYDPDFRRIFSWVVKIRQPDGTMPPLEDSNVMVAYPETAILEDPTLAFPVDYSRFHFDQPNSLWKQLHYSSDDVVADYIAAMTQPAPLADSLFQVLPESGNLVFRSGWDPADLYWHFTGKNGRARDAAKGHNQADASSFVLYGLGQTLALDAGYLKWDRRDEVANAENHNMILVDGAGPVNGSTLNGGDADAFIEHDFDLLRLDHAQVRTSYQGADIFRNPLFVRRSYFLLSDQCRSPQHHTYQWRLHGYGRENGDSIPGNYTHFPGQNRGIWTRNGVSLLAQVTAAGGVDAFGKETNIHELRYDSMEEHTTLLADKMGSDATFNIALIPFATDTPQVQKLCASDCGTLLIEMGGYKDIAFSQGPVAAAATGLAGDLYSDGNFTFYSQDSLGDLAQYFIDAGRYLRLGADTLTQSSVVMDVALSVLDPENYEGHVSEGGTVRFWNLNFVPGSVLGVGVANWSYDASDGGLTVQFSQAGYFTIHQDVIIGVGGPQSTSVRVYPNPTQGRVTIAAPEADAVQVWDLQGRFLRAVKLNNGRATLELDHLPPGTYLLGIYQNRKLLKSERLVVQ
ncbi:MAG: T9SS type A sorting domain-containing protein [Bacteroidota bacterium]